MPRNQWKVEIENQSYDIELEHGSFLRKYKVCINELLIRPKSTTQIENGDIVSFNISDHSIDIIVILDKGFHYDLIINGVSSQTGEVKSLPPAWHPRKKGLLREVLEYIIPGITLVAITLAIEFLKDLQGFTLSI